MKIAWVARAPNPYRYPLWRYLASRHELSLAFLQETPPNRDWLMAEADASSLRQGVLPATGPRVREDRLWVLLPGWKRALGRADAIVLQGAWETPAFWQLLAWARNRSVPTVLLFESSRYSSRHTRGAIAAARRLFFRKVNVLLALGPEAAAYARQIADEPRKVVESCNTVDVVWWHTAASRIRKDGEPGRGHVFVVVAQLISRKAVDIAMRAFDAVANDEDALHICGTGPLEADLKRLKGELRQGHLIDFLGHLDEDDLAKVYARSHTLVLCSREEVWGLVANEALAAGLHAVLPRRSGAFGYMQAMTGVYGCDTSEESVGQAMARSRSEWSGWIKSPEILSATPEALGADTEVALQRASAGPLSPKAPNAA